MSSRAGAAIMVEMLALPARGGMRLPQHLSTFDISELDREVRDVLTEMSGQSVK
jgi:hypothetical protein